MRTPFGVVRRRKTESSSKRASGRRRAGELAVLGAGAGSTAPGRIAEAEIVEEFWVMGSAGAAHHGSRRRR
jgi:hypothetical protein